MAIVGKESNKTVMMLHIKSELVVSKFIQKIIGGSKFYLELYITYVIVVASIARRKNRPLHL